MFVVESNIVFAEQVTYLLFMYLILKCHSLRDRYVYLFVNLKVISAVHER